MPIRLPVKTKEEILNSIFMTRLDFGVIVDLPNKAKNRLYKSIRISIEEELAEEHLELPDIYHLPTNRVLRRLEPFGFSRKRTLREIAIKKERGLYHD